MKMEQPITPTRPASSPAWRRKGATVTNGAVLCEIKDVAGD